MTTQNSYDFNKITGKQLREIREEKKWTVLEFSEALGATPASVYRWEASSDELKLQQRIKDGLKACFPS